jgi:hypothetical protein
MKRKPIAQHIAVFWLVSPGWEKVVQWHAAIAEGRRNQKHKGIDITRRGSGQEEYQPLQDLRL